MSTYYEILKLKPTTKVTEIETALDRQAHHWQRLLTHHDPAKVSEANRALQVLEVIRDTLTDPGKRAAYDANLGLRSTVSGLADLQAQSSELGAPLLSPHSPTSITPRVDAWVCGKCQTPNPIGTPYCGNCGNKLGIHCPKCSKLTRATANYCLHCGTNLQAALREQETRNRTVATQTQTAEYRHQQQQIVDIHQQIAHNQEEIAHHQEKIAQLEGFRKSVVIVSSKKREALKTMLPYQAEAEPAELINKISNGGVLAPVVILYGVALYSGIISGELVILILMVISVLISMVIHIPILRFLESILLKLVRTSLLLAVISIPLFIIILSQLVHTPEISSLLSRGIILSVNKAGLSSLLHIPALVFFLSILLLYWAFWRGLRELLLHRFVIRPSVISEIARLRASIAELEQKIKQIQVGALENNP